MSLKSCEKYTCNANMCKKQNSYEAIVMNVTQMKRNLNLKNTTENEHMVYKFIEDYGHIQLII